MQQRAKCSVCDMFKLVRQDGTLYKHSSAIAPVCDGGRVNPYSEIVPDTLAPGCKVRYQAEPRPNISCPHCEATSDSVGEPDTLKGMSGKVGWIKDIRDPREPDDDDSLVCRVCRTPSPRHQWFDENGIQVVWRFLGIHRGVWAYPSELSIISERDYMGAVR